MKMMKKGLPVVIALISIMLFFILIGRNEQMIQHGKSIFISLQPADPRSILQGDYMTLRYNMNIQGEIPEGKRLKAYVKLNALNVVSETRFNLAKGDKAWTPIFLKKIPHQNSFYPAAQSYLFAEGLADCYSQAVFAEFKLSVKGEPLLYELKDAQRRSLNCEAEQRWRDGSDAIRAE